MHINPIAHMKALTYWNPLHDLLQIRDCATGDLRAPVREASGAQALDQVAETRWVPILDLTEDDGHYFVQIELPGVDKQDVEVTVEDGMLKVHGERRIENAQRRVHRSERCYGHFSRSLVIPDDADADQIEARFQHGLLQIRLSKLEARKPRKIELLGD